MPEKYQNKYRIPSARLQTWDYGSNSAYFITICTAKRQHYFGQIINGKMELSDQGKKANQHWSEIPDHFSFVTLDEFIVMPNHIHGIIVIDKPFDNNNFMNDACSDRACPVTTCPVSTTIEPVSTHRINKTTSSPIPQPGKKHHFGNGWFV